jgi:plasmid stability protein
MSKLLQIRNVPESVHRTLKARAARAGMSLSDYLLAEVERLASRPTLDEMRDRLQRREPVRLPIPAARIIRAERDAR